MFHRRRSSEAKGGFGVTQSKGSDECHLATMLHTVYLM